MLQRLGDHIRQCLARALECEQRAEASSDPQLKAEHREMASRWRHVALCYESNESLERFLLDSRHARMAGEPGTQ